MMVKDVNFITVIWGIGVCLNWVCVCRVLSFRSGELQSLVLTWRGYIAHNNQGGCLGACSPRFFLDFLF